MSTDSQTEVLSATHGIGDISQPTKTTTDIASSKMEYTEGNVDNIFAVELENFQC